MSGGQQQQQLRRGVAWAKSGHSCSGSLSFSHLPPPPPGGDLVKAALLRRDWGRRSCTRGESLGRIFFSQGSILEKPRWGRSPAASLVVTRREGPGLVRDLC